MEWWRLGMRHRAFEDEINQYSDGYVVDAFKLQPAIVYSDGSREWWVKGERHNIDGAPAIVMANGHQEWWENGKKIPQNSPNIGF